MVVISTTNYADFKTLVNLMRKVDMVIYNQSANISWQGGQISCTVAYAFDMDRKQCVSLQAFPIGQFVTTDFPSAVAITGHLLVGDINSVPGTANPF